MAFAGSSAVGRPGRGSMKSVARLASVAAFATSLAAAPAGATMITYIVPLSGANEVPAGSGDPDGTGTATLMLDDVANTISWSITVANLDPVILDHIHSAP